MRTHGLLWQAVTGRYAPRGDPADGDCVIGFAFGHRGSSGPGLANEDLAALIAKRFGDRSLILQAEIAEALGPVSSHVYEISGHRRRRRYLDTREVAAQARLVMRREGFRCAIVVAQPHHLPRADAVCRKLGLETIVPAGIAARFDPRSRQPWTRDQPKWSVREGLAIAHYTVRRWI